MNIVLNGMGGEHVFFEHLKKGISIWHGGMDEDGVYTIFTVGLKFSSVQKLSRSLETAADFKVKGLRIAHEGRSTKLSFEYTHKPGHYYDVAFYQGELDQLRKFLAESLSFSSSENLGKVGRNDPCPCGSGKKFKNCCIGKAKPASPRSPSPLSEFEHINDPELAALISDAHKDPGLLQEESFWCFLGEIVGVLEHHELAMRAFQKALALDPGKAHPMNKDVIRANLAVTLSTLGNNEEALKILRSLPDSTKRKAIMTANVLYGQNRFDEAIPLYELAIQEEPDFYLAYSKLIFCLQETKSATVQYWFERAIARSPKSPQLAWQYCYYLMKEGRLNELAEASWIDDLKPGVNTGVIAEKKIHPYLVKEAQLFRLHALLAESWHLLEDDYVLKYAQVTFRDSEALDILDRAIALFDGLPKDRHVCDQAKMLLVDCVNIGAYEEVSKIYGRICGGCREERIGLWGPEEFYLAKAHHVRGNPEKVVEFCEAVLNDEPENTETLTCYYFVLDDIGRTDEAIEAGLKLKELEPERLYVSYNLGHIYMKQGLLGPARQHLEASLLTEPDNFEASDHLAFACLLDGDLEQAKHHSNNYINGLEHLLSIDSILSSDSAESLVEKIKQVSEKWSQMVPFAEATLGSQSYALDLVSENQRSEPILAGSPRIASRSFSVRDILDALDHPRADLGAEARHRLQMESRGDWSHIVTSLQSNCGNWDTLPIHAQSSLVEAEKILQDGRSADYAPCIVAYAKAVEIAIREHVFDSFKAKFGANIWFDRVLRIAFEDQWKQVHNFARYIGRDEKSLELGGMVHVFKLVRGKSGKKLELLAQFKTFVEVELGLSFIFSSEVVKDIEDLSRDWRNPAVHARAYTKIEAEDARATVLRIFDQALASNAA